MKTPYRKINKALARELDGVDLRPDPQGKYPYVLHFENDDVSQREMRRAQSIVNEILPSEWYEDEVRYVPPAGGGMGKVVVIIAIVCLLLMMAVLWLRLSGALLWLAWMGVVLLWVAARY